MRKKIIIVGILMAAVLYWAVYKYHSSSASASADVVLVQAAPVKETVLPVEVNAIGTLTAAKSIEITPEVAGHVSKVFFQDGTFVKKDTALIQLDDAVYNAKNSSAQAQLAYSENNYKRMVLLGKQGAIAKQAIDQAEADLKEKRAAAVENQVMVDKMKLTAPFDGVVGKSKVNPGDYVTVGQGLVTLTDTRHLLIEYNVPEKYLPLLKLGQTVNIKTSTYPDKIFTAIVSYIAPTINTENRSVSLYAEIANKDNLLAAGMFVNILQSLGAEEKVLVVPSRSLVPIMDGQQVYKIVDSKAYPVTVLTGKRTEELVQIIQGLSAGDMIITDGQLKVKNGTSVKIKS